MTKKMLAEAFRTRQLNVPIWQLKKVFAETFSEKSVEEMLKIFRDSVATISDEQIIQDYTTCSFCGKELLSKNRIDKVIMQSATADQFLDSMNSINHNHQGLLNCNNLIKQAKEQGLIL